MAAIEKACNITFDFTRIGGSVVALKPCTKGGDDLYRKQANNFSFEEADSGCLAATGPGTRDKLNYTFSEWIVDEDQHRKLMSGKALFQKSLARANEDFDNNLCFELFDEMLTTHDCYPPQYAYVAGSLGTPYTTDAGVEMVEYCPMFRVTFETLPDPVPFWDGTGECKYCVTFSIRECEPLLSKDALGATTGTYSTVNSINADYDTSVSGPFLIASP